MAMQCTGFSLLVTGQLSRVVVLAMLAQFLEINISAKLGICNVLIVMFVGPATDLYGWFFGRYEGNYTASVIFALAGLSFCSHGPTT